MKYIPKTMSLEDRAKMEYLESEVANQKENNEMLTQCVLELSEMVYK